MIKIIYWINQSLFRQTQTGHIVVNSAFIIKIHKEFITIYLKYFIKGFYLVV